MAQMCPCTSTSCPHCLSFPRKVSGNQQILSSSPGCCVKPRKSVVLPNGQMDTSPPRGETQSHIPDVCVCAVRGVGRFNESTSLLSPAPHLTSLPPTQLSLPCSPLCSPSPIESLLVSNGTTHLKHSPASCGLHTSAACMGGHLPGFPASSSPW